MMPRWDTVRLLAVGLDTTLVDLSAAVEGSDEDETADAPA